MLPCVVDGPQIHEKKHDLLGKYFIVLIFQRHTLQKLPPSHDFRMVLLKEIQRYDVGESVFTVALPQLVAHRSAHVGDGPAAVKGLSFPLHLNQKATTIAFLGIYVIRQFLVVRHNA